MSSKSPSTNRSNALKFGTDSSFEIPPEIDPNIVAFVGRPQGYAIQDPRQFTMEALRGPIGFPSLVEATIPGDRVAIAVGNGIPRVASIVAAIVETLANGRVEPADIAVVLPSETEGRPATISDDITRLLPKQVGKAISFERHNTSDRNRLAYLAASSDAKPIFFNRTICEADMVIPVGCLRPTGSLSYIDDAMGLFPTFADDETIQHFSSPASWLSAKQRKDHHERAREAAWLLGVTFTVQVLPGAGDDLLAILAGASEAVFAAGRTEMQAAWACDIPSRVSLVIAAIEGGPEQQTWENFAAALAACKNVVDDDEGAIMICSELADEPGRTLRKIRGIDPDSNELDEFEQRVAKETGGDALVAAQLIETLRTTRVYLYSQLDEETVEELGIAPVSRTEEIANLCRRHPSCAFLANAQRAVPVLNAH